MLRLLLAACGMFTIATITAARAQQPFTVAESTKLYPKDYQAGLHYGTVSYKLISYSTEGLLKKAKMDWYEVILKRAFGGRTEFGTFAIAVDLCNSSDSCAKPVARKIVSVIDRRSAETTKEKDVLAEFVAFISGSSDATVPAAEVETNFTSHGDNLLVLKKIASIANDNQYTVRLTVVSIDKAVVEKGVLPEILNIYNSTATNPLVKASYDWLPGAGAIATLTGSALTVAEKLLTSSNPSTVRRATTDQPMQFINAGGHPYILEYHMPATGGSHDCALQKDKRKNCVALRFEFNVRRSIIGIYDIETKSFRQPVDPHSVWQNAREVLKVATTEDYLSASGDKMKQFLQVLNAGPYADANLPTMCKSVLDAFYKTFTEADAKVLYWAFIKRNWVNLMNNDSVKHCLGDDSERKQYAAMNLAMPILPGK